MEAPADRTEGYCGVCGASIKKKGNRKRKKKRREKKERKKEKKEKEEKMHCVAQDSTRTLTAKAFISNGLVYGQAFVFEFCTTV